MSSDHKYRDNPAHLESVVNFGKLGLRKTIINFQMTLFLTAFPVPFLMGICVPATITGPRIADPSLTLTKMNLYSGL